MTHAPTRHHDGAGRPPFWRKRQCDMAEAVLLAQWQRLEAAGTLDNFRIAAGRQDGARRGLFFVDSDAHKWADAAARTLHRIDSDAIAQCLDEYIDIVGAAQDDDGYLYTFNRIHFPRTRWVNLQVEHELYCHGHLIEAGIAAARLPRHARLLDIARKAADLLVREFSDATAERTPGHPEVELALLRLADATGDARYADLASRFLEQRGRGSGFGRRLLREFASHAWRMRTILARNDGRAELDYNARETLNAGEGWGLLLRSVPTFLSGRYQQQHRPLREMRSPVGHAVRWGYLAAAAAHLARRDADDSLLDSLDAAWRSQVHEHLYASGGIGAHAIVEGFGQPYDLGNRSAYCETCAAIASVLWSRELHAARPEARYADLIEWQLFNAVAAGISLDGTTYLYRNPLESEAGIERRPWFHVACCPSNISRTFASIDDFLLGVSARALRIDQLWTCERVDLRPSGLPIQLSIQSDLPWHGRARIEIETEGRVEIPVHLRIPGWAGKPVVVRDGEHLPVPDTRGTTVATASGFSPFASYYVALAGPWQGRTRLEISLPMEIRLHRSDARVRENRGKVALSRGPLLYCLEGVDNPGVPVPGAALNPNAPLSLGVSDALEGAVTIEGRTPTGEPLRFVPFYCHANRARSGLQVWVAAGATG